MTGQMFTCYSGGDVWNIQIPFSVAAKNDNTLVKRISQNKVKNKLMSLLAVKEAKKRKKKGLLDCTKTANPRAASQSKVFHKEDTQICWVEWLKWLFMWLK